MHDRSKVFNVCDHAILLSRLGKYSVVGHVFDWFVSYLSNRKQVVDINGFTSKPQPLDIFTIQGCLLGPILFLISINDFLNCTNLSSFLFLADTKALITGSHLPELVNSVNSEIKNMAEWFCGNKMALNTVTIPDPDGGRRK
jgi:hypothetical protein